MRNVQETMPSSTTMRAIANAQFSWLHPRKVKRVVNCVLRDTATLNKRANNGSRVTAKQRRNIRRNIINLVIM